MPKQKKMWDNILTVIMTLLSLLWIYPIVLILLNSLKVEGSFTTSTVFKLPTAETFAGLSGMGDLIVTCTSMHSRNLHAGMLIGRGKSVEEAKTEVGQVVEGINALPAACRLAKQYKVEMPIVQAVEAILDGKLEARSALICLLYTSDAADEL